MVKFISNTLITLTIVIITCYCAKTFAFKENILTLNVEFKKIKQLEGSLIIELYDLSNSTAQNWHEAQPLARQTVKLKTVEQKLQFNQLAIGRYAIRVFQDVNNNTILDRTANNLPLEPVGFSKNPNLLDGEPTMQDCEITLTQSGTTSIILRHRKSHRKKRR